jgi:hypothetical protein
MPDPAGAVLRAKEADSGVFRARSKSKWDRRLSQNSGPRKVAKLLKPRFDEVAVEVRDEVPCEMPGVCSLVWQAGGLNYRSRGQSAVAPPVLASPETAGFFTAQGGRYQRTKTR